MKRDGDVSLFVVEDPCEVCESFGREVKRHWLQGHCVHCDTCGKCYGRLLAYDLSRIRKIAGVWWTYP